MTRADQDLIRVNPAEANPGDIVVLATGGLTEPEVSRLLDAVASAGFLRAVVGFQSAMAAERTLESDHLSSEVNAWKSEFRPHVKDEFLEEVLVDGMGGPSRRMLTERTMRQAYEDMFGVSSSTSISFAKVYRKIITGIDALHGQRDYLREGTLFMGARKRGPGYGWKQRHWGITPEALFGLTLEDEDTTDIGAVSSVRIQHLLQHITDAPMQIGLIRKSGWLGHERTEQVG